MSQVVYFDGSGNLTAGGGAVVLAPDGLYIGGEYSVVAGRDFLIDGNFTPDIASRCHYCGAKSKESKYHSGTCDNCGAPL